MVLAEAGEILEHTRLEPERLNEETKTEHPEMLGAATQVATNHIMTHVHMGNTYNYKYIYIHMERDREIM